jgi:hypothetical protein
MVKITKELMEASSQGDFKKWLTAKLSQAGAKLTGSSRGGLHIRFAMEGELADFQQYFSPLNIEVKDATTNVSGTFPTYILTLTQDVDNLEAPVSLPWVNNYIGANSKVDKSFGPKDLTPESVGLAGKKENINGIFDIVVPSLKSNHPDYAEALIQLMNAAQKKGGQISISNIDMSRFNGSDLATISKNFGEVLSAIWSMNNLAFKNTFFPAISNEKLIDFYGERMGVEYPVSVKSGGGGKVTIQNILDALEDKVKAGKVNPQEQKSYIVFETVRQNSARGGVLALHKYFNTNAIQELSKITRIPVDDMTVENITEWTNDKSNEELRKILTSWLQGMKTKITDDIWSRDDKLRFIISPLGEMLPRFLNEDDDIRSSMSELARKLSILQVNVDVKKSVLLFQANRFKKAEFIFGWAGYASGNKLGFKMQL